MAYGVAEGRLPCEQHSCARSADLAQQGSPTDASAPTTAGRVGLAHLNRGSARKVVDACRVRGYELTPTGWSLRDDERVKCDSRDTNEGDTIVLADTADRGADR
jgi:hypothetical protein